MVSVTGSDEVVKSQNFDKTTNTITILNFASFDIKIFELVAARAT